MKKLIFFPIEIKSRELKIRLLMSLFALRKNFYCFIGDKHGIFRATKHFSPGSYFYKSMNHKTINVESERFNTHQIVKQGTSAECWRIDNSGYPIIPWIRWLYTYHISSPSPEIQGETIAE